MEEKAWFIKIEGRQEGPFTISKLRSDSRITPDTLARQENFSEWLPIRSIPELSALFEDPETLGEHVASAKKFFKDLPQDGVLVLDYKDKTPYFFYWLLVTLVVIAYVVYQLYFAS